MACAYIDLTYAVITAVVAMISYVQLQKLYLENVSSVSLESSVMCVAFEISIVARKLEEKNWVL